MTKKTNYKRVLEDIYDEIQPYIRLGKVADYIPELSSVPLEKFGMTVHTVEGESYSIGDTNEQFSIQSIVKVFTLTLAMQFIGDTLWTRVGREPSGNPFNSLVQLEHEEGIPRNPFINAGALVVTDVLVSKLEDPKQNMLDFLRVLAGNSSIDYDISVARSEMSTGFLNTSMAYFLKSFRNLDNDPYAVLETYFHHCSIAMNCREVSAASLYLANGGKSPLIEEVITTPSQTKYINSLMMICGTYDSAGDFAYRVGLPAKSGIGGGIMAVLPGKLCICVWSPGLNESGNSLAGTKALELFTTMTGISVF